MPFWPMGASGFLMIRTYIWSKENDHTDPGHGPGARTRASIDIRGLITTTDNITTWKILHAYGRHLQMVWIRRQCLSSLQIIWRCLPWHNFQVVISSVDLKIWSRTWDLRKPSFWVHMVKPLFGMRRNTFWEMDIWSFCTGERIKVSQSFLNNYSFLSTPN